MTEQLARDSLSSRMTATAHRDRSDAVRTFEGRFAHQSDQHGSGRYELCLVRCRGPAQFNVISVLLGIRSNEPSRYGQSLSTIEERIHEIAATYVPERKTGAHPAHLPSDFISTIPTRQTKISSASPQIVQ